MTLGVVCVHGLGGTPHSVLPVTAAVHGAGYPTVSPMLPGHGTQPSDLLDHTWTDWLDALDATVNELAHRCDGVAIVGQSMGGTLALIVATMNPNVRGVAAINPLVTPSDPDATEFLERLIARGRVMQPAGDPDIRDLHAHDTAYAQLPLQSLLELGSAAEAANNVMARVAIPVLVITSEHDGVVDPANSDLLAATVSGPVRRLRLANSAHVAALDLDREQLCRELLTWLVTLTDESAVSV